MQGETTRYFVKYWSIKEGSTVWMDAFTSDVFFLRNIEDGQSIVLIREMKNEKNHILLPNHLLVNTFYNH